MKTRILVDSSCDLPKGFIEKNKAYIDVIGIPVVIGDKEYFDDLGLTFEHASLYDDLNHKIKPNTGQISSHRFYDRFEKYVKRGEDVLYIGLSKSMSKTNRNAFKAANKILKEYPESSIKVIDSNSASIGLGLLARIGVEMLLKGCDVHETYEWISNKEQNVQHWFSVDDLNFLKQGGRIESKEVRHEALLKLKSVFIVDYEGKIKLYKNVRGRKNAINFLYSALMNRLDLSLSNKVVIGHGDALEDALLLKEMLEDTYDHIDIMVTNLSAVIAAHVGPKMLAISYMGNFRE